ncbi:Abhydrolase_3 domain-containing protein [Trichoderma simmonsii]|uniref:Abhydrolase_3 domain-containing protein n=1 Tax=Trichoderma simmonsii TaxID=1491479 RepID=A0A8G0PGF2_9HYPO|nr:Abhydrolase_3 domain-containing protein [Trichoderma simmonsii]
MADFSYLGGPSEEWIEFSKQLSLPPRPNFTANLDMTAIRQTINSQRFLARNEELKAMVNHGVKCETIMVVTSDYLEIPVRLYTPPKRRSPASVLLYFYGGGFFSGSLSVDDAACINLARKCGLVVVSVGYRLTPEWKAPTQFQDAWDVRCWVLENAEALGISSTFNLYVMGISAGACLAASIAIRERMSGEAVIKGQSLCVPWLCLPEKFPIEEILPEKASPTQCRDAALLPHSWVLKYSEMLGTPDSHRESPVINPLLFDEQVVTSLPPSHIMVCGDDPLRDHGMLMKQKLDRLRVLTKLHVYPGYPHFFRRFPNCPANKNWDSDLLEGLQWMIAQSEMESQE